MQTLENESRDWVEQRHTAGVLYRNYTSAVCTKRTLLRMNENTINLVVSVQIRRQQHQPWSSRAD